MSRLSQDIDNLKSVINAAVASINTELVQLKTAIQNGSVTEDDLSGLEGATASLQAAVDSLNADDTPSV